MKVVRLVVALAIAAMLAAPARAADPNAGVADFIASGHARSNYYRAMAKLPPLRLDPGLSNGAALHARYLVANGIMGGSFTLKDKRISVNAPKPQPKGNKDDNEESPPLAPWLTEDKGKPFYTDAGASAAYYAVVLSAKRLDITGTEYMDQLVAMPITSIVGVLSPQLERIGVGGYCTDSQCAVVITARVGLEKARFLQLYEGEQHDRMWNADEGPLPFAIEHLKSPVEFPPDGSTVSLSAYDGTDWPNAIKACPDYSAPTGFGISLQLGQGNGPSGSVEVTDHSLSLNGTEVESCVVTAKSFSGDSEGDATARRVLSRWGAALVIARQPLKPGRYQVSISADSKPYSWSFTVGQ
ncbi:MAG TPA: CAP domain-containing protein [Candidatus Binataceae bacterium]|nr:CAP domain-containing protein [Candidatus Binataceae bacterium]